MNQPSVCFTCTSLQNMTNIIASEEDETETSSSNKQTKTWKSGRDQINDWGND